MPRRFLILHGLTGSSPGHWQGWIARRLRKRGHWVSFPNLPDSDHPSPRAWTETLEAKLTELAAEYGERIVLCHSLGSVLWLRHASRLAAELRPDRVLLVAPACGPSRLRELTPFFPVCADRASVAAAAARTLLICSDNDPYCPQGAESVYGVPLAIETEIIHGGEHLNTDAGYGPWPDLEAWCLGLRSGVAR